MKYRTKEDSFIDSVTKRRAVVASMTITGMNAQQFEAVRALVIELYNREKVEEESGQEAHL